MALTINYNKRFKGINWQSGHIYKFKYSPWAHDPEPVIILMYSFSGTHPRSGHEWHFFQGINFTYIPRKDRKKFAERWMQEWQKSNGNLKFTWGRVQQEFPYLKHAVRRYFYKPNYYISKPIEVPMEDMDKVIISTWSKDFSKKLRSSLISKFKKAKAGVARMRDSKAPSGKKLRK
jgi:hypothetical protein